MPTALPYRVAASISDPLRTGAESSPLDLLPDDVPSRHSLQLPWHAFSATNICNRYPQRFAPQPPPRPRDAVVQRRGAMSAYEHKVGRPPREDGPTQNVGVRLAKESELAALDTHVEARRRKGDEKANRASLIREACEAYGLFTPVRKRG